jgi:hypothetical protein
MKEYDFDPRNLPQDLLAAIGLMTTSAAQTEWFVESAIAGCLGLSVEYGAAVTTHMNMPLRLNVLKSAAEIRIVDLEVMKELEELLGRIDAAFRKRNDVVHHTWLRDPDTGKVGRVWKKARERVELEVIPMSADQVRRDARFVYQAGIDLFEFLGKHDLMPRLEDTRPLWKRREAKRRK